ncbi:MAG: ChaN family lipoprotein [Dissulfurispiraceae bacterium]
MKKYSTNPEGVGSPAMKKFTQLLFSVLVFLFIFGPVQSYGVERVVRISDGKVITFMQMIQEIRDSNIIFVGEAHNNTEHHAAQLQVIKSLEALPVTIAVGLEMFKADSQNVLNHWLAGRLGDEAFIETYLDNWGYPWQYYRDIFLYAKQRRISMIGLNVSPEITQKVSQNGFSSLTPGELKQLPPQIGCDIDERYMDYIKKAYEFHGMQSKSFIHFCEAQMIWDKVMAWNLAKYLTHNPGTTVVVLAGTGHAWKRGIPEQLRRQYEFRYKVVLPEIPDRINTSTITTEDADYILLQ